MTTETAPLQAVHVDAVVSQHFNQLTPAEAERLALLAEKCGDPETAEDLRGQEVYVPVAAPVAAEPTHSCRAMAFVNRLLDPEDLGHAKRDEIIKIAAGLVG